MRIAILSDIHDNVWRLNIALAGIKDADAMVCCGDLCSPFIVDLLANGFRDRPIHIVFGNNDGDLYRITQKGNQNVHLYGEFAELVELEDKLVSRKRFEELHGKDKFLDRAVGGKRIAVNHYDNIAIPIAASELYDLVFFGHNHRFEVKRFGNALALNPGAIMGYDGVKKQDIPSTFAIYDTLTNEAKGYRVLTAAESETGVEGIIPHP